jgi:predicted dehydrogenase
MHLGVVGVGWWGKNIVNTLERFDDVSEVSIFDGHTSAYDKFANNKKTMVVKSFEEMLSDKTVAAVCVATPPDTHYAYSKKTLLAGKHLLVEKPPAIETSQVRELGEIAANANLVYMLDALYLFAEPIRKLKEILSGGELKNLRYVQMFRVGDELRRPKAGIHRLRKTMFANGVNVIDDLFFHDAAIILYLFGEFEYRSSERLYLYDKSCCDTARINLVTHGVPIELTLSWTLAGRRRGVVIYDQNFIVEYLNDHNGQDHVTKHDLQENKAENFAFPPAAPLDDLLHYFLCCVKGEQLNRLGPSFFERITEVWRAIRNDD